MICPHLWVNQFLSLYLWILIMRDKVNKRSRTGVLIFCNNAPIYWYSKQAPSIEASTFGAEFYTMSTALEMIKTLRCNLRIVVIPLDGPTSVFCDNEAVYKNTSIPTFTLNKKVHHIAYRICREVVASKVIQIVKEGTDTNLSDIITKILSSLKQEFLLERFTY